MTDETAYRFGAPGFDKREGPAWSGKPGQIANWRAFALSGVLILGALALPIAFNLPSLFLAVAVVPVLYGAWAYLVIRCTAYEVSSQRLRIASGVLNRYVEEIELYRIEDSGAFAPLVYRLVGRGNAFVVTSDRTASVAMLEAIPDFEPVRRQLRELVEAARTAKGVRVIE